VLLGAGLLAGIAVLGLAEGALRLWAVPRPEGILGSMHVYSEVYGWVPRKGHRQVVDGILTTINDRGYRGLALADEKGHRLRVVVLGDSIAFGLDMNDADTFSALLGSSYPELEVANLAVPGYGPDQELMRLEREGLALQPDVVVLALCLSNDLADASLPVFLYDGRHPKPYFTLESGRLVERTGHLRLSRRQALGRALKQRSLLYAVLAERLSRARQDERPHWLDRAVQAVADRERAVSLVGAMLARMAEASARRGAVFVVAAFPGRSSPAEGTALLRDLAAASRLPSETFIDMRKRFRRRGLYYGDVTLDDIGHLNRAGHRAAAEVLHETFLESGLLELFAAVLPVEVDARGLAQQLLGHEHDLAGVVAHVLGDVQDHAQAGGVVALDAHRALQVPRPEPAHHALDPPHDLGQARQQVVAGGSGAALLRELRAPPARVRLARQRRQHPLPEVAGQVQEQVAHAVAPARRAPPHLALVQAGHAEADLLQVLAQEARAHLADGARRDHGPWPRRESSARTRSTGSASAAPKTLVTVVARSSEL
jgi:hypothetical protein